MSLARARRAYERTVDRAAAHLAGGHTEQALAWAQLAAGYAWRIHLGLWRDDRLEDVVGRAARAAMGEPLTDAGAIEAGPVPSRLDVAFVATGLYGIGGHTRVVRAWSAALSKEASVGFAVTGAGSAAELPAWASPGLRLVPSDGLGDRVRRLARWLRQTRAKTVILAHNPNDVVAVGALAALTPAERPRVLLFNHADHVFWLGAGQADHVLHYRLLGATVAAAMRGLTSGAVIPLAGEPRSRTPASPVPALSRIPAGATVSLTLTGHTKTRGDPDWVYFRTMGRLLRGRPDLWHVVASTHTRPRRLVLRLRHRLPSRLLFVGTVTQPDSLYERASFVVESFPLNGGMVRLEATLHRKPVLAVSNRRCPLFTDSGSFDADYPLASTEDEVVRIANALCDDPGLRAALVERLVRHQAVETADWEGLLRCLVVDDNGWTEFEPTSHEPDARYMHAWARPVDRPRLMAGIALPVLAVRPLPGSAKAAVVLWSAARVLGAW
ncbi:MAG: hypothetical protein ACYC2H_05460 [Thermoplasmatota archaeon]